MFGMVVWTRNGSHCLGQLTTWVPVAAALWGRLALLEEHIARGGL